MWRFIGSVWLVAVLVALASWNVTLISPFPGLDPSWLAGLYMAADRGLSFGSQLVFTYGPLGFLSQPWLWYPGLAVLAWWFSALLQLALAISVVWALRRSLGIALAAVFAAVLLIVTPSLNLPLALAAIWCLAALSPDPPRFACTLVLYGGAALGAIETLIQVRTGPVILVMCAITLAAQDRKRARLLTFVGVALAALTVLWFAAGQALAGVPDFVSNSFQIVVGYSDAMGSHGYTSLVVPGLLLVSLALVAVAAFTSAPGPTRVAATLVMALAGFALYKEAVVRADEQHAAVLFATAAVIVSAAWYGKGRAVQLAAVGTAIAVALIGLSTNSLPDFNPVAHARDAADQLRVVLSPSRLRQERNAARRGLVTAYGISRVALRSLRGHTVQVEPWEAAAAWAYGLDWDPLPVFQIYSAYTSTLDDLNRDAERSPHGPQRILRENTQVVDPYHSTPGVDSRVPAWDPPQTALAMLCNYEQVQGDPRWEVLAQATDRCGRPQAVGSVNAAYRHPIAVPRATSGSIVYAVIDGLQVSGLERLKAFVYRANLRYVLINGARLFRVVPGTATDGLLLDADPRVDYPPPYSLSPSAHTLTFSGGTGRLRVTFYRITITARPPSGITNRRRPSSGIRGYRPVRK